MSVRMRPRVMNGDGEHVQIALAKLSRAELAQALARVSLMREVLKAEIARRIWSPLAQPVSERYLTVDEVAKRLKLGKPRIYELIRQGKLAKVAGLGSTIRVPEGAFNLSGRSHLPSAR
jgi:excisionase family DNA binding protein